MMEAALGISVFINDHESYDKAMEIFLKRVPAYIYLTKSVLHLPIPYHMPSTTHPPSSKLT